MTAKKVKPPPDDPEQSARFMETAKNLQAEKSNAFGKAIDAVLPRRRRRTRTNLGK